MLAPMSGVTDIGMRRIARRFGATYVVTEMVACETYLAGESESRLRSLGEGVAPHVVQLVGRNPTAMGLAATPLPLRKSSSSRRRASQRST